MRDEDAWFEERGLGRFAIVNWRGLVCVVVLGVLLFTGMGVESAFKRDRPVLELVLLVPLGLVTLSLAWTMATRTRRADRHRSGSE